MFRRIRRQRWYTGVTNNAYIRSSIYPREELRGAAPLHPYPTASSIRTHVAFLFVSVSFFLSRQDNPAREALTIKCVRVIVENFERLPAHDATGGLNVCSHPEDGGGDDDDLAQQETKGGESGDGVSVAGAGASVPGQSNVGSGGGTETGGVGGESKLEAGEDGQAAAPSQQQREGRAIPAKFLQLISAGLSTDLDPKVRGRGASG